MQHQEKYTLHWHSYSDHLKEALNDMMLSSEFADVTLVTDDKQQIRAHRNILSAASPVFKSIFQIDSNNANQVIYLRGIQHSEMESIMQFIYLGEARFYEERMSEFLMVSKNLEIKELSTGIDINDQTPANEESNEHENGVPENFDYDTTSLNDGCVNVDPQTQTTPTIVNQSGNRKVRRADILTGDSKFKCKDCERIFKSYQALRYHTKSIHEAVKYACNQCDKQFTEQSSLTRHIQSEHEGVKYACNQCDYQSNYQSDLRRHIQSKHEGVKYPCNQCDYQATQQGDLTRHIKSIHKGVKYACSQCDYKAGYKSNLTTHIQSKHEGVKYMSENSYSIST